MILLVSCCNTEFDLTYPAQLKGIISRDEYQKSIARINHSISMKKTKITLLITYVTFFILTVIFYIVFGTASNKARFEGFIWTATAMMFSLPMLLLAGYVFIILRRKTRKQQAIAKESMKYSMRSPISCSWRSQDDRVSVILLADIFHSFVLSF